MFKRKDKFVMMLRIEVDFDRFQHHVEEGGRDPDLVRDMVLLTLSEHIDKAATDALRMTGQKLLSGHADLDGGPPTYKVGFKGDRDGAVAAYEHWANAVDSFQATARILVGQLRGADGTDLRYMDEEYEKEVMDFYDGLPRDARDELDRMLDLNQQ